MPLSQSDQYEGRWGLHSRTGSRPMSLQRFSSVHRPTMSLGEEKPSTISNEHRAGLARLGRSLSVGESTARGRVLRRSFSRSWISPVRGRDKECGNRHEMRRDPEEPKHQDVCPQTVKQDEPTGWSAEDIARRKFKSMLTMGPGLPVLKHNRNKGRSRRVLSFDAKTGLLTWTSTFPTYTRTSVAANTIQSVKRGGNLVKLSIKDQGDVGFQCSRLTDAIVLAMGLTCVIRDMSSHAAADD